MASWWPNIVVPEALYWGPRHVAKILECEGDLHHRKRLLVVGCSGSGRRRLHDWIAWTYLRRPSRRNTAASDR